MLDTHSLSTMIPFRPEHAMPLVPTIQSAGTLSMAGLIWMVQVLHRPLRTTWAVGRG